jgi:hypothetical protein
MYKAPVLVDPRVKGVYVMEDGKRKMKDVLAGTMDDSALYDTTSSFLTHKKEGKNLQVGFFTHTVASASAPARHEDYTRTNKATSQHAWVAFIAKRTGSTQALFIYDTDINHHPIYTKDKNGKPRPKGLKELLNNFQYKLHNACKSRGIREVYLASPGFADNECALHAGDFVKAIMERGDLPVDRDDEWFKEFVLLTFA